MLRRASSSSLSLLSAILLNFGRAFTKAVARTRVLFLLGGLAFILFTAVAKEQSKMLVIYDEWPCRWTMKDAGLKSVQFWHITQSIGWVAWCGKPTLVGVKVILDTKSIVLRAVLSSVVLYGIIAAILRRRQGLQKASAVWRWKTVWEVFIQKKPPEPPEPKLRENVVKEEEEEQSSDDGKTIDKLNFDSSGVDPTGQGTLGSSKGFCEPWEIEDQ